jgi:DNA-binding response OmpR family regulator
MKIVALDDSKTILATLKEYLKDYELTTFSEIDDFIMDIIENHYDIFLVDINLPNGNGLDIISEIKDYPHLQNSKFVILTAEKSDKYREIAKKIGVTAYIKKPFSPKIKEIIKIIQERG